MNRLVGRWPRSARVRNNAQPSLIAPLRESALNAANKNKFMNCARVGKCKIFSANVFASFFFVLQLAWIFASPACAASWTLSVDDRSGLPSLSKGGGTAMSSNFAFWQKNWVWANLSKEFKVAGAYDYSVVGTNQALNLALTAHIKKASDRQLVWDFDLDARNTTTDVVGGGVAFALDLENFGSELGEPELLPDNCGWSWGKSEAARVEMRFDPPAAAVYFERGNKSDIKVFFYKGEVPEGHRHYVATLTVSGDVALGPTAEERFGLDNVSTWPAEILDWRTAPVDLSFLNAPEKPAGKHGFLTVDKDKLVFKDGTPIRFWGTNLTANALFATTRENVRLQAHRLSELGFNLVRIHHHDSSWVVPNIFGDRTALDTKALSLAMLEKLDWWIKCLEDEGIYVWLDLHVGRQFKFADGIDGFSEISKGKPTADLKGYNYVNMSIEHAMQRFNDGYLTHRNTFTGVAYKDDPGIAALLLTNENDITYHFGNALLPDKQVPQQNALYMAQAEEFAAKFGLPKDKTWRAWERGPAKLFLNDLEHRFDVDMIQQLLKIGVKVPVVTTSSWGNNPLSSLPALLTGDVIDVHAYGGIDELKKNPLYAPTFLDWMAAGHVINRPLSVTEWNVSPFPTPDRDTVPIFVASFASFQGYNAMMQFAYSQGPLATSGNPSNWEAYNDPAFIATLPAAALLYRRGDVKEANTEYVLAPTPEQLFNHLIWPKNSVALRTAVERGKLVIALPQTRELPWLEQSTIPPGAQVITDPNKALLDVNAGYATSDTGELRRDWEEGTYKVNTPRSQAAMGWIGGKQIDLADVSVAVTTRNATVAVQSLDGADISNSRSILISLSARSVPESGNRMPFHSEPVVGRLTIHARKGLKLYKQLESVGVQREIPTTYQEGQYQINLDQDLASHWLVLK
jgi:hypothetical protein